MALPQLSLTLTPRRKLALMIAGYVLFFGTCFVLSAYYAFPYERVRDLLVRRVASQPALPGQQPAKLSIAELGPHWLSGIALEGVEYERKPIATGDPAVKLTIDELTARLALLSLWPDDELTVTFGAAVGDGTMDGEYVIAGEEPRSLKAELDELDLGRFGVGSFLGIPVKGKATGTIELGPIDTPTTMQGSIELKIDGLKLGDGKAKLKLPGMAGGLTLETVNAGDLEMKVTIRDGVATVEKLESKGKDVQLTGSGSVRMSKELGQSRSDLALGVKVEDGYKNKSDRTKAMFDLMSASPLLARALTPDGTIRFRLTGPISAMRAAPGAGAGGAAVGKRSRKGKKAAADEAAEAQ